MRRLPQREATIIRNVISSFALAFAIALHGCGGITGVNAYVNKQYQGKPKSTNKLTIVPLTRLGPTLTCTGKCPALEQVTDEFFEKSFGEFKEKVLVMPMAKARMIFGANLDLLNKLLDLRYSEQELNENPGLKVVLDSKGLASLRDQLDNADLLLVPARLDLVPQFGWIFGYSEFHLYDLSSGSMIYSSSRNMNINRGDEAGRGLMAIVLIGKASEDFGKLSLNK